MVVLRDVPDLAFSYFGWRSIERRVAVADAPELGYVPEWSGEFDGLELNLHPQRIAIRIGDSEAVVFVPERADVSFRRFLDPE
jgi:hypothetical protein